MMVKTVHDKKLHELKKKMGILLPLRPRANVESKSRRIN